MPVKVEQINEYLFSDTEYLFSDTGAVIDFSLSVTLCSVPTGLTGYSLTPKTWAELQKC